MKNHYLFHSSKTSCMQCDPKIQLSVNTSHLPAIQSNLKELWPDGCTNWKQEWLEKAFKRGIATAFDFISNICFQVSQQCRPSCESWWRCNKDKDNNSWHDISPIWMFLIKNWSFTINWTLSVMHCQHMKFCSRIRLQNKTNVPAGESICFFFTSFRKGSTPYVVSKPDAGHSALMQTSFFFNWRFGK